MPLKISKEICNKHLKLLFLFSIIKGYNQVLCKILWFKHNNDNMDINNVSSTGMMENSSVFGRDLTFELGFWVYL